MSSIRIALFETSAQAEPLRQRLLQAGIPAEIRSKSGWAKLWYVSKNRVGTRLHIPARFAERARALLLDCEAIPGLLKGAIRCPECKSFRVEFPQYTEKSLLTNLAVGFVAELHLIDREYYCEDCHCMWARQNLGAPRPRRHLAPDYFLEDLTPNRR